MNLRATQAEVQPQPRGGGMKFTYPSGSRPLDGFTIKRGIGRGGFGEVYYATSDAGKEVALKLIRRNLDVELRGVTQCLNLKHPHLLVLYDVKQDDLGDSWVVMEFVSGECLDEVVARHPDGLPLEEALAWFRGIAAGVAYLHDHGIVHRDLKPGNIFRDEGLVKIGDYGLSKFISASRRSGQTESVGTVHYMAPEVGNGRYGKEIDIYALGIILYEVLTGRVPFDGESVGEVLMKHLTAEPDLSGLHEPYRTAVARALAKDPERRLQSVSELMELLPLSAVSGGSGEIARPTGADGAIPRAACPSPAVPADSPFANPATETVAAVEVVDEEPIWRAIRTSWAKFTCAWNSGQFNTPAKIGLIIAGVVALSQFGWFVLALVPLYFAYYLVRAVVLALRATAPASRQRSAGPVAAHAPVVVAQLATAPQQARAPPVGAPRQMPERPRMQPVRPARRNGYAQRLASLPAKSGRQRLEELLGSLLLAPGVVAATCALMVILRGQSLRPEQFAWLVLVSAAGAWLILTPGKLWEGRVGEPLLRRFGLMSLGLGLGAVAWLAKSMLLVDLNYEWQLSTPMSLHRGWLEEGFYDLQGVPSLTGHLAYFALLMAIPAWWRQADPARRTRFSVWATLVAAFWAVVLSLFWPFPQPWGVMVAAATSIAVQLASPWYSPQERRAQAAA